MSFTYLVRPAPSQLPSPRLVSANRTIRQGLLQNPWFVAAFLSLLLAFQIRTWWSPTPDVTGYLSIARSVWSGHGLSNRGSRELLLAPGFPILVSPAFLSPHHAALFLSLFRFAIGLAVLAGIYRWAAGLVPRSAAILTLLFVGCNFSFWRYYRTELSELPMMMWMLLCALAMRRALVARSVRALAGWCVLSSILLIAATFTRQAAVALGAGFFVAAVLAAWSGKISWKRCLIASAVICLPCAVAVVTYATRDRSLASANDRPGYLNVLRPANMSYPRQVAEGLHLRISEVGRLLIPGMGGSHARADHWPDPNLLLYLPATIFVVIGWWKLIRRTNDPFLWAIPFYAGLYVVWHFDQDTRFFTPILPALVISLWPLVRPMRRVRWILPVALCVLHLVISAALWVSETRRDGREYAHAWPALTRLANTLTADPAVAPPLLAARGLSSDATLWLQYLVDRPVARLTSPAAPIPPNVTAIVEPASAPVPAGFVPVQKAIPFRLSRRLTAGHTGGAAR